jgi:hypothetical protein
MLILRKNIPTLIIMDSDPGQDPWVYILTLLNPELNQFQIYIIMKQEKMNNQELIPERDLDQIITDTDPKIPK